MSFSAQFCAHIVVKHRSSQLVTGIWSISSSARTAKAPAIRIAVFGRSTFAGNRAEPWEGAQWLNRRYLSGTFFVCSVIVTGYSSCVAGVSGASIAYSIYLWSLRHVLGVSDVCALASLDLTSH